MVPPTTHGADPGIGSTIHEVLVVGAHGGRRDLDIVATELDELEELARTLEADVRDRLVVNLREPHPATFLRPGGVEIVKERLQELGRPAVLVNDALSPRQQRNLEAAWEVPVLDRTEVILAIFARRAHTAEGRVQVRMAQLNHLLPRLAGGWTHLERQRGGVGLRGGAGEKQIEVDRRLIRQEMKRLKARLKELEQRRRTQRSARSDVPLPSCALVGYTNAGKSTLLNRLTNSQVFADDLLFATLDPTSRLLGLPSGRRLIVTDTVGFIQNLPTELVEAFASTLEEVRQAHILAVVVDASHPEAEAQLTTVLRTLEEMSCSQPAVLVLSKVDRVPEADLPLIVRRLGEVAGTEPLPLSSVSGAGVREMRDAVDRLAAAVVPETRANRSPVGTQGLDDEADADDVEQVLAALAGDRNAFSPTAAAALIPSPQEVERLRREAARPAAADAGVGGPDEGHRGGDQRGPRASRRSPAHRGADDATVAPQAGRRGA